MVVAVAVVAAVAEEELVAEDGEEAAHVVEEEIQVPAVAHLQVKLNSYGYFSFPDMQLNLGVLQHQVEGLFSKPCARILVDNPRSVIDQ